jgi:hypothetical protein
MNLPHLKPVRFVQDVIVHDNENAKVSCLFPYQPTLAMIVEAAAQSSAVFSVDDISRKGFLVLIKDTELLHDCDSVEGIISISQTASFGNQFEFSFSFLDKNQEIVIANGSFMILLQ